MSPREQTIQKKRGKFHNDTTIKREQKMHAVIVTIYNVDADDTDGHSAHSRETNGIGKGISALTVKHVR